MRPQTIGYVWLAGIVLALGLYATGPEQFLLRVLAGLDEAAFRLQDAFYLLGTQALEAMRAAAIALYVVFVALSVMAVRRGLRGRAALIVVSLLFLLLLQGPGSGTPIRPNRWMEAFALSAFSAAIMTHRLVRPSGDQI